MKKAQTKEKLEASIGPLLRERNMKLVLAESCTGGLVGDRVTDIPGASEYYVGSIAAYAYEAKERLLGVKHETLLTFGAVSRETALEMAVGARQAFATDFGLENMVSISITGIAGPGGATPTKPVGLVWISLSTPRGTHAWRYIWKGNRRQNKEYSAEQALVLLTSYLHGSLPEDTY